MPAIRGCWTLHPVSGLEGIWVELSTDPPGTITGLARTAWPVPVTTGPVGGRDTVDTYAAKINTSLRSLATKAGIKVVIPTITFSSISPLTIDEITISEGDIKAVRV